MKNEQLSNIYPSANPIQCPLLNRITLGQHKSDNKNRMIPLTNVFCVLLIYNWISIIWLQYAADSIISDPIKPRALYSLNKLVCYLENRELKIGKNGTQQQKYFETYMWLMKKWQQKVWSTNILLTKQSGNSVATEQWEWWSKWLSLSSAQGI